MILVDPRRGSGELVTGGFFKPYDVPVTLTQLEFGDFAFYGNGPDNEAVMVGFERKVLSDMVTSMRDGRLSGHQLPGLFNGTYAVVHIVVEGVWRCGRGGLIETRFGKEWGAYGRNKRGGKPVLFRELDGYLATLQYKRGVVVAYTGYPDQTAAYVVSRYKWWNEKVWEQHRSDEQIYAPFVTTVGARRAGFGGGRTVPVVEKMIAQLVGVDAAAYSIARQYPTMESLMEASIPQLAATPIDQHGKGGKRVVRLGAKKAESVWLQLRSV